MCAHCAVSADGPPFEPDEARASALARLAMAGPAFDDVEAALIARILEENLYMCAVLTLDATDPYIQHRRRMRDRSIRELASQIRHLRKMLT